MIVEITPIAVEPDDDEEHVGWVVKFYTDRIGARMLAAHIGTSILMEFPNKHPADVLKVVPSTVHDPDAEKIND